jgi:hypothetical protein
LFTIPEAEKALVEFDRHTGKDVIERLNGYTPQPGVPYFVYHGWSVYQALSDRAKTRTSTENVSDVLDAIITGLSAGKEAV